MIETNPKRMGTPQKKLLYIGGWAAIGLVLWFQVWVWVGIAWFVGAITFPRLTREDERFNNRLLNNFLSKSKKKDV